MEAQLVHDLAAYAHSGVRVRSYTRIAEGVRMRVSARARARVSVSVRARARVSARARALEHQFTNAALACASRCEQRCVGRARHCVNGVDARACVCVANETALTRSH
eukprot:3443418-Pleurochrysis_carterae.AAC.1